MTLQEWLDSGWVKGHRTSPKEVTDLLGKVDRDINESQKDVVSLDWRLAIAYNACLGCATIALRASGYRIPGGTGQHYRTIQSLRFTIRPDSAVVMSLEAISKKRAVVSYDMAGAATVAEVAEAIALAQELKAELVDWLRREHPELLS